jgi:hypothetical protein
VVECLPRKCEKCEALSSISSTAKKKERKKEKKEGRKEENHIALAINLLLVNCKQIEILQLLNIAEGRKSY